MRPATCAASAERLHGREALQGLDIFTENISYNMIYLSLLVCVFKENLLIVYNYNYFDKSETLRS